MASYYKAFIFYLILPFVIYPQSTDIRFERITVEQGLPQGLVHDILQDHQGFMWFATEDGLFKYDGYTFTTYRHDPDDSTSLGSSWVTDIHEDLNGILWLATIGGGLNKFNREKEMFVSYKYERNNTRSISSNQLECIDNFSYKGKEVLWIGTAVGLNKFDPETGEFTRYPHTNLGNPYRYVEAIVVDTSGKVWVGSGDGGLHKFDPETEQYTHYRNDPGDPNSLSSNLIYALLEDRTGDLWVGTGEGGLNKFDRENETFLSYSHDLNNPTSLSNDLIASLLEDKAGMLWIGTSEGLNAFDRENKQFTRYKHNPDNPSSISDNTVMYIYEDKSGVLWVGTWGGVNKIDPQKSQFSQIRHIPGNDNSLSDNNVTCIYESHYEGENILWIGTKNGGLNKLNRSTGKYTWYKHNPENPNSLINNFVYSICEGREGLLWIGNFHGGLNKLDRKTGKITRYKYDPQNPNSLSCQSVNCIFEDKTGILWIGTQTGGINTFDPESEQFTLVSKKMMIIQIYLDQSDELWFATLQGLKKLDKKTGHFKTYRNDPSDPTSISHNEISSIYESKSGEFWIGTFGRGLNLFDRESGKFTHYTVEDGLPNDLIIGILEDEQNNLWVAYKGISKFNPKTKVFKNYDFHDGLIGDQFNEGAYFKCRDGQMLFGGKNGLNAFYPKNIKDNTYIPPVFITNFRIFNEPVPIKKDGTEESQSGYTLSAHISSLNEIKLPYTENVFSFEFAALDYHSPQKNKYAYKMEGVDPNWVFTDASRRFATYTQLDPGEYTFRVKGSNKDGVWNEEGTSINIIITPPWWRTNLAYTFYVMLFGFIIFGIWRFQTNRLRMKQQMEMEHFEAEKLREVDKLKTRFFANISHEFRTPLTLIKGPVKQMLTSEIRENIKEQYKMILRNSDRLLGLINQILDLSKLESGGMKLKVSETNIVKYLKGLVLSFAALAELKKIKLEFKVTDKSIVGYLDRDKLEKITGNLLSNAFKFTPEGGVVEVLLKSIIPTKSGIQRKQWIPDQVRDDIHSHLQFTVSNSGDGIPVDRIDKIFDRFYQADDNYKKDSEGSGIGLALTKELVEVCHGEISVSSIPNKTATFVVTLPIAKECFKEDEIIEEMETADRRPETEKQHSIVNQIPVSGLRHSVCGLQSPASVIRSAASSLQSPMLLIVEDNPDVTSYICSFMEEDYRILTAENGKIGMKKTLDKFPDLIISDVMMPEMDGFELCQKIKTDERISHIPVILLTAKADLDSKIEGLEFGADDYINKPFEAEELKIRSKNLIEQRKKLREKFSRMIEIKPGDITVSSMDEQFMERLLTVFEKHLSDSGYSTKSFATEVGISPSQLNRKLRALTNLSTHGFMLNLRLKRAAQFLKKKAGTISEIAYLVGFESPSKFARAFRSHYGQSPSDFSTENKK